MKRFKLTLRNYRCFRECSVDIGDGFTALVGPNNSGKTSLLRSIHELRELWSFINSPLSILRVIRGENVGVSVYNVYDQSEIRREASVPETYLPLIVEIEFLNISAADSNFDAIIRKATFKTDATPTMLIVSSAVEWDSKHPIHPNYDSCTTDPNDVLTFHQDGQQFRFSVAPLVELARQLRQSVYLPSFRNAINVGAGNFYDMEVGSAFVAKWDEWQTGPSRLHNQRIERERE